MKLAKPSLVDILRMTHNAREEEIEQHEALYGPWNAEAVAADLFTKVGHKFVLLTDAGEPVVVGGWDPLIDGVWQSWMVGTAEGWEQHWRSITKFSHKVMRTMFQSCGARRLQTNGLAKRVLACKWYAEGLGMTHEGTMRGFGLNGEDLAFYSRVKEDGSGR